ncbi:MAG: NrsF family protein, partial [Novosphingobium sp.]
PAPIVIVRASVLLLAGLCLLLAAVRSALPGRPDQGASLAGTVLLGLFPLGLMALLLQGIVASRTSSFAEVDSFGMLRCFTIALSAALIVGIGLIAWMRIAAPTDLVRTSWLTGWAAGALGTFAYSLFCPASSLGFVTTVYPAATLIAALLFRLVMPGLVRW